MSHFQSTVAVETPVYNTYKIPLIVTNPLTVGGTFKVSVNYTTELIPHNYTTQLYHTTIPHNYTTQLYHRTYTTQLYHTIIPHNYTTQLYHTTIPHNYTTQLYHRTYSITKNIWKIFSLIYVYLRNAFKLKFSDRKL